jgi:DNA polymerase-1
MIIGEAPGYREDDVKKPFAGKSGRLLDETLLKYGLNRQQAFISNVAKCRPPENRTPTRSEFKACRPYLEQEIEAVKPEFILLLGNSALSLLKKSGIMRHRGEIYEYNGSRVFASVHPAAVLRNPHYARIFESDVATFGRMVRGEPGAAPTRTYLVRDAKALKALCKSILTTSAFAYDLETNGFEERDPEAQIVTIGIAVKPGVAFVVPIHHPQAPWKHPDKVLRIVGNAMVYSAAKKIAHNAKFDDRWLNQFGIEIHTTFDTMLAAHMLDENRLKGLKPLAQMILGVDPWKDVDLGKGGAKTTQLTKLARYNAKDADYTLRLYYLFRKELQEEEQRRIARIFSGLLMPASSALTDIERTGMWLDLDRLAQRRIQVEDILGAINRRLTTRLGHEGNWNSPRIIAELLFDKMGLEIQELTKGGAASTRESVLLHLKHETNDPSINDILEWRKWTKYDSTYLGKWARVQRNGRVYPNYKLTGTVTGRLASGKEQPNDPRVGFQQVPRDTFIRSIIGSPPGWKFVEADFSQIELRIVAHYSQDPTMMRIFQSDGDIHLTTPPRLPNT